MTTSAAKNLIAEMVEKHKLARASSFGNEAEAYIGTINGHDIRVGLYDGLGGQWAHITVAFGGVVHFTDWENRTTLGKEGSVEGPMFPTTSTEMCLAVIAPMSRHLVKELKVPLAGDILSVMLAMAGEPHKHDYTAEEMVTRAERGKRKGQPEKTSPGW